MLALYFCPKVITLSGFHVLVLYYCKFGKWYDFFKGLTDLLKNCTVVTDLFKNCTVLTDLFKNCTVLTDL
jgi:hypothetical protein